MNNIYQFDLTQEPLTNQELKTEREKLKIIRKEQIKYSCISDVLHTFVFIALYFSQILSGYAVLVAVGISTGCALMIATATRNPSKPTNSITILLSAVGAATTVVVLLTLQMQQTLTGSIIAGLLTASIVIVGATLGRRIKKVLISGEELKSIVDDPHAQQELKALCQQFPELEEYRQQAASYLRPTLTYGELKAMREKSQTVG
jgi:TusA-related sulfurtransferase